jgi:hypothetical protein
VSNTGVPLKKKAKLIAKFSHSKTVAIFKFPHAFYMRRTLRSISNTIIMTKAAPSSSFPIPSSLQDLERAPYNLLPYPHDFEDDDEAARADSFLALVHLVEQGNRTLVNGSLSLFEDNDDDEPWMDGDRIQALYTLVR